MGPDDFTENHPDFIAVARTGDGRGARVVEMESSEMARELFERALKTGAPIIYDATLANRKVADAARAAGYETRLVAVSHDAVDSLKGARERVKEKGRYVTTDYGLKAHASLNANIVGYAKLFDKWELHDRDGEIASKVGDEIEIVPGREVAYSRVDERANAVQIPAEQGRNAHTRRASGRTEAADLDQGRMGPGSTRGR